jgi:hypothetical protein
MMTIINALIIIYIMNMGDLEMSMRYKLFGQGTGLRVSELVLGCGALGSRWGYGADFEESRRIFEGYADRAQLDDNLGAAGLDLNADEIARLDTASAIPLGFPHEMLAAEGQRQRLAGGVLDRLEQPIIPIA